MHHRYRCACPRQHPDVNALGCLCEEVSQRDQRPFALDCEVRVDRPSCNVYERARTPDRGGDGRKCGCAINVHLDSVSLPDWTTGCPSPPGAAQRLVPAEPREPTGVMTPVCGFDEVAD